MGYKTIDYKVCTDSESRVQPRFFKGTEFISVSWEPGVYLAGFENDILLEGPTLIIKGWKSLKTAGFEGVDAFVPNAQFPDQPWGYVMMG
jgi:hypothetical protein